MTDTLPTVWDRPEHTRAKHQILETYLQAWLPIMSRQAHRSGAKELLFVDGFAGPGRYTRGEEGSPILAIRCILEHSHKFPVPISLLFIEKVEQRFSLLKEAVERYESETNRSAKIKSVKVERGDCETILNGLLDERERIGRPVGPAFFFLDQSGYSDVPMRLIQRIMARQKCEVFAYLNWDHMNRFLVDEDKRPAIDDAFGSRKWRDVFTLKLSERPGFMVKAYRAALKEKGNSQYVWDFAMCDENDKLLYWLFFCTNNVRGLEEMKRVMWKVDQSGGFRFSDKENPLQLRLFANYDDKALSRDLIAAFQGTVRSVAEIKEFALSETPAYKYKSALKMLWDDPPQLTVSNPPVGWRKGTFASEQMQVKFFSKRPEDV